MSKPNDRSWGKFIPEHYNKMGAGITMYNLGQYWECHEYLEDLWREDMGDNARYVYWAIIQVATSLYHYEGKNLIGAWGMLFKAKDKIHKCEKLLVENSFMDEYLQWNNFKKLIVEIPRGCLLEDFNNLYQFKFPSFRECKG